MANEERHRIHEIYSEKRLKAIYDVWHDPSFRNNNERTEANLDILKDLDVTYIASGTNRMAVLIDDYIHKIALDSFGVADNWQEFKMSPLAQPVLTKTYESNGLIDVAEYANLMNMEEFADSREHIAAILEYLSENFLFCDISLTTKNFCNFGYRDNGDIVIVDYGYLYPLDRKIMRCRNCGSTISWNKNYTALICDNPKCHKAHDPIEIKTRMDKKETDFIDIREKFGEGPLVLELGT